MIERRHGYSVSLGYTAEFFREMAPDWLDFCIRAHGFEAPRTGASFRYLDLGCGQGFHICLLAAANPEADFVGIDFNSEHIAHGKALATAAGLTNVNFIQADFLDLAEAWPKELGTFDYMALQGILSWISSELRAAVMQCVAHGSRPGTVASFGYNTPPGWLNAVPFQHVANQFARGRDAEAALESAITMFRRLRDVNAQLFDQMPRFRKQLEVLAAQPRAYLVHELLTDHWTPLWHSTVAEEIGSAGFTYVGSAAVAEASLPHSLPPELSTVITEQTDDSLRQDVQDIVVTQQFRRDIFCRDPRPHDSAMGLDGTAPMYLFAPPPEGNPVRFTTSFGGLTSDYAVVADIVAALADGPRPVAELMELKNPARPNTRTILLSMIEAHILMIGSAEPGAAESAHRFNATVARAVADGSAYHYLAAGTLGSGIPVPELNLLLLDTWLSADCSNDDSALAQGVAQRLKRLGRQLEFRGSPLADDQLESHIAKLSKIFVDEVVPQWRQLGVVR